MARPLRRRRVCQRPRFNEFAPKGFRRNTLTKVVLTLDEYEAIRLIDKENLNQEDCATQMNVARTTIQRIYASARSKIAEALVEGKLLLLEGGDYILCDDNETGAFCGHTCRRRGNRN